MSHTTQRFSKLLVLIVAALCLVSFASESRYIEMATFSDSEVYLNYAEALSSNESLLEKLECCLAARTPGYPALLAVSFGLFGHSIDSVNILHLFLGVFTGLLILVNLRAFLSPIYSFLCLLLFFGGARVFFYSVLTEWSAICLLCAAYSFLPKIFRFKNYSDLIGFGACLAAAVTIRPVLLPLMLVPVALIFYLKGRGSKTYVSLLAVIFPLILCIGYNFLHLSRMSLSPFAGVSLFGVASLIEQGDLPHSGDKSLDQFIDRFNQTRAEGEVNLTQDDEFVTKEMQYNLYVWKYAGILRAELGIDFLSYNDMLLPYSLRLLAGNWKAYLLHILEEFFTQFFLIPGWHLVLYFVLILFVIFSADFREELYLIYALGIAIACHFIHMLACSATNAMFYRLFATTYYPCFLMALLTLFAGVGKLLTDSKSGSQKFDHKRDYLNN